MKHIDYMNNSQVREVEVKSCIIKKDHLNGYTATIKLHLQGIEDKVYRKTVSNQETTRLALVVLMGRLREDFFIFTDDEIEEKLNM